jgi:hypothetical protein
LADINQRLICDAPDYVKSPLRQGKRATRRQGKCDHFCEKTAKLWRKMARQGMGLAVKKAVFDGQKP